MPLRVWVAFVITATALRGSWAAEPDPLADCRKRVVAVTQAEPPDVDVHRNVNLENGDYIILWNAKLANGRTASGFCEASVKSGRIVQFERNPPDGMANRTVTVSRRDAEMACQREARKRLGGEVGAMFDGETDSTYYVWWRCSHKDRPVKTGWCEVDSSTGRVRKIDEGRGG